MSAQGVLKASVEAGESASAEDVIDPISKADETKLDVENADAVVTGDEKNVQPDQT